MCPNGVYPSDVYIAVKSNKCGCAYIWNSRANNHAIREYALQFFFYANAILFSKFDKTNYDNCQLVIRSMNIQLTNIDVDDSFWAEIINSTPCPSSSFSNPSTTSKSSKSGELTDTNMATIKEMHESLDKEKMWKLKTTKRTVELIMKDFALDCTYEHPSHSLILDLHDKSWNGLFSPVEIQEIKQFEVKKLPEVPADVQRSFNGIIKATDAMDACRKAGVQLSDPEEQPMLSWAEFAVLEASRLFFGEDTTTLDTEFDLKSCFGMFISVLRGSLIKATNG